MMRAQIIAALCAAALLAGPISATAQEAVLGAATASLAVEAPDGSIRYPFGGKSEPLLTCRPLFVCDIALQPGETVLNLAIGDSLRWVIAAAQSGPGGSTPHVLVKPTELNLATNLIVTTTKRVYYLRLASAPEASQPRLSYSYPDDESNAAAARLALARARAEDKATEIPSLPPDQLDYNYRVSGATEIMPKKVYNDGVHSFIEYAALPTDLPVVYGVAPDGANQIVNYRLKDLTFIVDGIPSGFDLVLNAGTGKHGRGERRTYIRHK